MTLVMARRAVQTFPPGRKLLRARDLWVASGRILRAGLFDIDWYQHQTERSFNSTRAAALHYLLRGRKRGLTPNMYFEPAYADPGSWRSVVTDPLVTLLYRGHHLTPVHPVFDPAMWVAQHPEAVNVTGGALAHYLQVTGPADELPGRSGLTRGQWREVLWAWSDRLAADRELRRPRIIDDWDADADAAFVASHRGVITPAGDSPLISVVMPVRNRPTLVLAAIASLRAQTCQEWELVVVDDGSDDSTPAVLAELAAADARIRVITQAQSGAAVARNAALAAARGEYVGFLDSDNEWLPHFVEVMINFMQRDGTGAAYCAVEMRRDSARRYLWFVGGRDELLVGNHADLNALVLRRDVAQAVGGFDAALRRMIDWDYALKVSEVTHIGAVPFVGVQYNEDPSIGDRISVKQPYTWAEVVIAKHTVNVAALADRPRRPGSVSILVPAYEDPTSVITTMRSLYETTDESVQIVLYDNGSVLPLARLLLAMGSGSPRVTHARGARHGGPWFGFLRAAELADGETLVLLPPGVVVMGDWLSRIQSRLAAEPDRIIAAAREDESGNRLGGPDDVLALRAVRFAEVGGPDVRFRGPVGATDLIERVGAASASGWVVFDPRPDTAEGRRGGEDDKVVRNDPISRST